MNIQRGLFPHMVLQRTRENVSDAPIAGTAAASGTVQARVSALLGCDGSVKLWIDGKALFADAKGYNPAIIDQQRIPFTADKGRHEVLVALGSNFGRAWGIFLRFERSDLTAGDIKKGDWRLPLVC